MAGNVTTPHAAHDGATGKTCEDLTLKRDWCVKGDHVKRNVRFMLAAAVGTFALAGVSHATVTMNSPLLYTPNGVNVPKVACSVNYTGTVPTSATASLKVTIFNVSGSTQLVQTCGPQSFSPNNLICEADFLGVNADEYSCEVDLVSGISPTKVRAQLTILDQPSGGSFTPVSTAPVTK